MKRILLGLKNRPFLVVNVEDGANPFVFEFYVENGDWYGKYMNNEIFIHHQKQIVPDISILCDDQSILVGHYNSIIDKFLWGSDD